MQKTEEDIKSIIEKSVKSAVKTLYGLDLESIQIEHPSNEVHGDFAVLSAFDLAKQVKQSPRDIAKKLCYEIKDNVPTFSVNDKKFHVFSEIAETPSGFINFKISDRWLQLVLSEIMSEGDYYGALELGKGKTILVEFSQPNPNKPMHVGHARNNFIGSSLSNIFKFLGYSVIRANYMNDWGTHICKSMLMYQKYGNNAEPDKKSDHFVGDFYIMYEKKALANDGLKEELAGMFKKLESGDKEITELWKKIVNWAYEGWKKTYENEGVVFDTWLYQHDYKDSGKDIVKIAMDRGIAEKDATGAVVARLEKYGIPDKVLLRADGTSIYSTQDLQMARDSYEKYKFDQRLYVVDVRQSDYFKQIFKVLELFGFDWAKRLHHVSYGFVSLPEGKMSSRTGLVVNSDDVFERLKEVEGVEIKNSLKEIADFDDVIDKVSLAAFRYGLLKVDAKQDLVFDYNMVAKFDGNTGPYLMYTYARAFSVLNKAKYKFDKDMSLYDISNNFNFETDPNESALLRHTYKFKEVLVESAERYAPHTLCLYLFELAQRFNAFYATQPILTCENAAKKNFRLLLTASTAQILKTGQGLLGIETVERM